MTLSFYLLCAHVLSLFLTKSGQVLDHHSVHDCLLRRVHLFVQLLIVLEKLQQVVSVSVHVHDVLLVVGDLIHQLPVAGPGDGALCLHPGLLLLLLVRVHYVTVGV